MRTEEAIQYFGTQYRLAKALDILPHAIYDWGEFVPKGKACELQLITGDALMVDWSCYPRKKRVTRAEYVKHHNTRK